MIPGMAWELDAESRRIALEEGVQNNQAAREAMAARAAADGQAPRRSWPLRAVRSVAAWMDPGRTPRRTSSPSTR